MDKLVKAAVSLDMLKSAAALAAEQDEVELKEYIYCYKDKAVNKFAPPFVNDKEPAIMVSGLRSSIIKAEHVKELTGLQFCFCGTFELKTGVFELFDKPSVLIDCDDFIEKIRGDSHEA